MWWTVLAVAIAALAALFLFGSQIFRFGGKGGQSVADVNANRFWWKWGRRPGD